MLTNQIAAAITAVILAISGVALATGDDSATVAGSVSAQGSTSVTVDDSSSTSIDSKTSVTALGSTSTTLDDDDDDDTTSTTAPGGTTSTTIDDDDDEDDSTTSTTLDDDDARQVVELGMRSYTVGSAGTVVMNGMVLVGVTANPGWTVEIDEANTERVKVEFHKGEAEAEFDLRVDGRLEIKIEG